MTAEEFRLQMENCRDMANLSTRSAKEEIRNRLQELCEGKIPDTDDLLMLAETFEYPIRNVMNVLYGSYPFINMRYLQQCIEQEDIRTLHLIAATRIIRFKNDFYLVTAVNSINEDWKIDAVTIACIRELLLKNGYPLTANRLSGLESFYCPAKLKDAVCSEDDLKRYMFGSSFTEAAVPSALTAAIFNHLDEEDQDSVLSMMLETFRSAEPEVLNPYTLILHMDIPGYGKTGAFADRDIFDQFHTDNPKKQELTELIEKNYR